MKELDYAKIGLKIRQARLDNNLTQEQLSEKCDISTSYLGHIERGTRKLSLDTLVSISSELNLSIDYLLADILPANDAVLGSILNNVKKNNQQNYERYITIIKALSDVMDKL